jgi:hypothetical protein
MSTGLNDLLFETHEHWQSDGPPRETFLGAGPLFLELKKPRGNWGGTGIAKNPQRSKLSGNGGPNFTKVRAASTPSGGVQFLQPIGEHWEVLQVDSKFLELLKDPSYLESGMDGLMDEMEQKVTAWNKQGSYLLWGEGKGAVGKGDGAYTISGNTIKLLNSNSARCFEVGDVLRFSATATYEAGPPAAVPAVRDGSITVTKVNETAGTVVVSQADISVAISGATNADYIVKDSYVGSASPLLAGIFTWAARNNTIAAQTLYSVDRSVYPERLAGRRIPVSGTDSPWTICSAIMREAINAGARGLNRIYVPSSEVDKLMEEMASRNIVYQPVNIGEDDPARLRMVVSGVEVGYGGIRAVITVDPFLIDHSVTAPNDKTYVGLTMDDWTLDTTESQIGWKDYAGAGTYLTRDPATQILQAEYGMYGNLGCLNCGHQIVARVGAAS